MKKLMFNLSKTEVGSVIAILWTLSCLLVYCGLTPNVSDATTEKMYSIQVMIVSYYFVKQASKLQNKEQDQ